MKTKKALLVLACAVGMFTYTSCQDDKRNEADEVDLENFNDDESDQELMIQGEDGTLDPSLQGEDDNAVAGVIERNEDLRTFSEGMNRAGMKDDFSRGEGPYTIFAPSNIAYDELSQEERNQFENVDNINETGAGMHYLVVRGKLTSNELKKQMNNTSGRLQLTSLQGENLQVSMREGNIVVTDPSGKQATVRESDIDASNGIVHVIDGVLHPKDLTRNDNPPKNWNPRNDQMNWEEGDINSTENQNSTNNNNTNTGNGNNTGNTNNNSTNNNNNNTSTNNNRGDRNNTGNTGDQQ